MYHSAYIGLGSNLDEPAQQVLKAIERINSHGQIELKAQSSLYKTEPFGQIEQDWFINAVIEVRTSLPPHALLKVLLETEKSMGRVRKEKWGPRTIDLDLLLYEDLVVQEENLTLPHPGIPERGFVLVPLDEIARDRVHPKLNQTIGTLRSLWTGTPHVTPLQSSRE